MWIADKICIFVFSNNSDVTKVRTIFVVNCWQNLYLCILKQRRDFLLQNSLCCELLTKFVSLYSQTTDCLYCCDDQLVMRCFRKRKSSAFGGTFLCYVVFLLFVICLCGIGDFFWNKSGDFVWDYGNMLYLCSVIFFVGLLKKIFEVYG